MDTVKLTGKTVIVTGANSGIGKETARELARRGAHVILACRDMTKAEEARREIIDDTKNEDVVAQKLDLASLQSITEFAEAFKQNESRLDILVNNAGIFANERRETSDGFEMVFGTNHLGPFYLTNLLLDKLKSSAPSRIVVVASQGHEMRGKLDLDNLQLTHGWGMMAAYSKSKTANILFATHLAKLLAGTGVTTYSLHPGAVRTDIGRDFNDNCCMPICAALFGCCILTPDDGAKTSLYCCLEPRIAEHSGRYYRYPCVYHHNCAVSGNSMSRSGVLDGSASQDAAREQKFACHVPDVCSLRLPLANKFCSLETFLLLARANQF